LFYYNLKQYTIIIVLLFWSLTVSAQTIPSYQVTLGDISQTSGYYFIHAFKNSGATPSGFHSMILDKSGNLVYYKKFNFTESDFKLLTDGRMSYAYSPGIPAQAKFHIMDSTFNVVDSVQCQGILTDNHDLQLLPNGHYLMMGYEFRIMDLSSYHWFNGNGTPGSTTASVKCGIIQELDQNKNLVFSWYAADHYQFGDVQEKWLSGPNNVDWTHFNSLAMDSDGNILVSLRHFSEVTKINRTNGSIIWRMGGKQNQFTFINDPYNGFDGQHDARRIANGNVTLYDDGYNTIPFHPARGVEYSLNESTLTAQLVWSKIYSSNSFAVFLGNVQRLDNGNTVIGWGGLRNANVTFNCVKPDGNLILEMRFPDSLITYRAFNYPALPFKLNRPVISCGHSGGNYYLSAPSGYTSYKWSTGDTTITIPLTAPGTYNVFVPYGTGGYISSEIVKITTMVDICSQVTGVQTVNSVPDRFEIYQNYPNPFNPMTNFKFSMSNAANVKIVIYDLTGREVQTLVNDRLNAGTYYIRLDGNNLTSGVYFYRMTTEGFSETRKMLYIK